MRCHLRGLAPHGGLLIRRVLGLLIQLVDRLNLELLFVHQRKHTVQVTLALSENVGEVFLNRWQFELLRIAHRGQTKVLVAPHDQLRLASFEKHGVRENDLAALELVGHRGQQVLGQPQEIVLPDVIILTNLNFNRVFNNFLDVNGHARGLAHHTVLVAVEAALRDVAEVGLVALEV